MKRVHRAARVAMLTVRASFRLAAIRISAVAFVASRRRAQEALLIARTDLLRAGRVATMGQLTASIAHEVNQPLTAIVTHGEAGMRWLQRQSPDLTEVETAISHSVAEGRRAAKIVQRIRDFLDKAPTRRERVDVATVIDDAVHLVRHELACHQVELCVDVEPHLPAVIGDRVQLQQVLLNLIVNANQAMSGETATRRLSICAARAGEACITISVKDNGPGIAPEHMDCLFDAFFTTKPDGMGMGLAICKSIANGHGGRLSVESGPGRGATFRLSLYTTGG